MKWDVIIWQGNLSLGMGSLEHRNGEVLEKIRWRHQNPETNKLNPSLPTSLHSSSPPSLAPCSSSVVQTWCWASKHRLGVNMRSPRFLIFAWPITRCWVSAHRSEWIVTINISSDNEDFTYAKYFVVEWSDCKNEFQNQTELETHSYWRDGLGMSLYWNCNDFIDKTKWLISPRLCSCYAKWSEGSIPSLSPVATVCQPSLLFTAMFTETKVLPGHGTEPANTGLFRNQWTKEWAHKRLRRKECF